MAAALGLLVVVLAAAAALAAAPRKGAKFKGTLLIASANGTSGPVLWGKFHSPVTFKVSRRGTALTGFTYSEGGCFGIGGIPSTTDAFKLPSFIKKVGAITISAGGTFKAAGSKSTYGKITPTTTITAVSGKFTSARKAKGTITFTQSYTLNHKLQTCGPVSVTFSAKAH